MARDRLAVLSGFTITIFVLIGHSMDGIYFMVNQIIFAFQISIQIIYLLGNKILLYKSR